MSYQYTHDARGRGVVGVHSFSYDIPIFENRDHLVLFGSYADFDIPAAVGSINGDSWQLSGRYRHTLCRTKCQLDTMQFGIDLKGTDNTFDFQQGSLPIFTPGQGAEVVQFMAGLSSAQQHSDGQTLYGIDMFASPSNLLSENRTSDFKTIRADSHAMYAYLRGYLERAYDVGCRSDFVVRMSGQLATNRLLPSEQLIFGGYNSIRGYDMSSYNGDNGYVVNFEYRTKPLYGCCGDRESNLTAFVFSDLGHCLNWGDDPTLDDNQFLASAGVGFRYLLNPNFTVRFDYGVPLVRPGEQCSVS